MDRPLDRARHDLGRAVMAVGMADERRQNSSGWSCIWPSMAPPRGRWSREGLLVPERRWPAPSLYKCASLGRSWPGRARAPILRRWRWQCGHLCGAGSWSCCCSPVAWRRPRASSAVAPSIPPVAAGAARIFFYRAFEPYETRSMARVQLNGAAGRRGRQRHGLLSRRAAGPVRHHDPGHRGLSEPVQDRRCCGPARPPLCGSSRSAPGRLARATLSDCYPTFVVRMVDPATAAADMQTLVLVAD